MLVKTLMVLTYCERCFDDVRVFCVVVIGKPDKKICLVHWSLDNCALNAAAEMKRKRGGGLLKL